MRPLIPLALIFAALPALTQARNVYETHFSGKQNSACFIRSYDNAHLAKHPDQLVTSITVSISPLSPGGTTPVLNIFATFRGDSYYYHGAAYCRYVGDDLGCALEGDQGAFTLSAQKGHKILLQVGRDGLEFEGASGTHSVSGTTGDDRSFLIPSVPAPQCN